MQEVIVYRNPMEAAMWGAIMSSTFWLVVFIFMITFAVTYWLLSTKIMQKVVNPTKRWNSSRESNIALVIASVAVAAFLVFSPHFM